MALVAGLVGIVGSVLFVHSLAGLPVGTAERIADYPAAAMVVVLGAFLLGSSVSARARAQLATPRTGR
jgi:multidrug transporter EmrE-like cation transporter